MRYAVTTFGCRVNQADSLQMELQLRARGATPAPVADADVVIVNSCSVTAAADQGVRQTLRRVARENPAARVVATGCYATRAGDEIAGLPGAPEVVPNDDKETIVDRLLPGGGTTADRFGDGPGACGALISPGSIGRVAFMLRVQTGCDEACAYCIIPSTRGRGRSLDPRHVLAAIGHAAESGFHEVVLNGVHLGSYGRDLDPPSSLAALLRAVDGHPSDVTCRISSLEPMDCPAALIDLVASSGRFAPHFHLPLQHASDRLLRSMRRPYTLDRYRRVVDRVRDRLPHAGIGADLIAGFPRRGGRGRGPDPGLRRREPPDLSARLSLLAPRGHRGLRAPGPRAGAAGAGTGAGSPRRRRRPRAPVPRAAGGHGAAGPEPSTGAGSLRPTTTSRCRCRPATAPTSGSGCGLPGPTPSPACGCDRAPGGLVPACSLRHSGCPMRGAWVAARPGVCPCQGVRYWRGRSWTRGVTS